MSALFSGIRLFFVTWKNKKPVHLQSTIVYVRSSKERMLQQLGTGQTTSCVAAFKWYNKFMGGTDGLDWRVASFRPKFKTKSWVPKVYIHLFRVKLSSAVVNSYLIYRWHCGKTLNDPVTVYQGNLKQFPLCQYIELLMIQLAEEHLQFKRLATPVDREAEGIREARQVGMRTHIAPLVLL